MRLRANRNDDGNEGRSGSLWLPILLIIPVVLSFGTLVSEQSSFQGMQTSRPSTTFTNTEHQTLDNCLLGVQNIRGIGVYSQYDEDGAILQTLRCMGGHGTKEYFEFGSETGVEVNSRLLRDLYGWHGHLMDGSNENPEIPLHKEFITPSNIVSLMVKYNVSKELDFLSVDVDYDDFFITREILLAGYRPRLLMNEYNSNLGHDWAVSVQAKPVGREASVVWKGDCYYGVSAPALIILAKSFGYIPVFTNDINILFVRLDQAQELGLAIPSSELFPRPMPVALHGSCSGKTWTLVDPTIMEKAADDAAVSHSDFLAMLPTVTLTHKDYRLRNQNALIWRHFQKAG